MFDQHFDLDGITLVVYYILRGTGSNHSAHHYQDNHGSSQCDFPPNKNEGDSIIHMVSTLVCSYHSI